MFFKFTKSDIYGIFTGIENQISLFIQATYVDVVLCREKQSSELSFERGRSPPPQTVSQHRQIDTSISVDVVEW